MLSDLGLDLRHALRTLGRTKASAVVLMVSLAAGLGANAVLYSAIDALLFRPPAGVVRPSRLVTISTSQFSGAANGLSSWPDVRSLAEGAPAIAQLAPFDAARLELAQVGESAQRVRVAEADAALFAVLGGAPELGKRLVSPGRTAQRPPAVISDALWTAFGRPDDIVGRQIRIGERVHVVAGVGPAGFRGLELARPCDVWVPLDIALRVSRGDRRLSIVARLADGADVAAAQRQADALAQRLATEFPDTNRGARGNASAPRRLSVRPYSRVDPSASGPLVLLGTAALGATMMLLVSACVNAASVLVSRSAARRRELAVKVALGASRARLVRQTLVEGWLLASLGAALGLLLAHYTAAILPSRFTPEEAEMLRLTVDTRIVAALIVFAIVAGALFAVGPARHVIGTRDIEALRAGTGQASMSHGRTSIRRLVVIGQIALSAVILVATGVLVRAMSMALDGGTAGAGRHLAIALVEIPGDRLGPGGDDIDYPGRAREAIRKLSNVVDAGWVMTLPLRQPGSERFAIEAPQGLVETIDVDINTASADYFATMGMALLEGRTFDAGDRPRSEPVVVVNDVLAQRYFGGAAIDQFLREHNGRRLKIVGVVQSAQYRTFEQSPEPALYFPPLQREAGLMHLVVRTLGSPEAVLEPLRARLLATSTQARVMRTLTFDEHVSQALTIDRLLTTVVAACGLLALALSTLGVYGVSADAVQRRTGEIGLRVALGARPRSVVALVAGEACALTAGGAAVGVGASMALAAFARTEVHGLPWPDLGSLAIVSAALLIVALCASGPPSWRALRISPTIALRTE